ncbi:electron transfer flavoprotein-ubiquinone oxidoreductase [Alteromonas gilva]|uniref:Electron transfer flavoprotein-ubiquinone oxidoreductase n=1 Tax=Alteromonas gilva TaxID=2987522 RepID=A0ABT5KZU2_9ALTE|nr:electron transfer flavoprotein-ubiquinone oxidoreductase [Alteromonas gilva]MDC8830143.1 electron transfer flavoprotein-ubiquinone oxidoreductase [Alteromonas gilva]
MDFDVVIIGAGPAGLSAAYQIKKMANANDQEISVCVLEKGSEVGAHILSGAILETSALDELIPDWQTLGAPLNTPVTRDELYLFKDHERATKIPGWAIPAPMHNDGNYVISLGNFCRWLANQAENIGVEIFPGFAAADITYHDDGSVKGVLTGDMGVAKDGTHKDGYMPGMALNGRYTLFAEGCRGHLGKQLIERFKLDEQSDPQHYAIGIKELWEVDPAVHEPGLVVHGSGWPLDGDTSGGCFMYHAEDNQVVVGLIVDLNYSNPHLSPFDEFQQMKHHPHFAAVLSQGKRISYGARAIAKGGLNALPEMAFPGGLLIGCDAGTLNFAKIKGTHTAMKSGMLAAQSVVKALSQDKETVTLSGYTEAFKQSWLHQELHSSRNFGPALHKFGTLIGGAYNWLEQNLFNGKVPWTLHDRTPDYAQLKPASECPAKDYPKPDGKLSFDKSSSVYMSNTNHEEDQPVHLQLKDLSIPVQVNLPRYDEPAQRYCPAGVYEIVEGSAGPELQINAQNCVHCKTCDIKDPSQNICWVVPEGAGGPNYPNM